MEFPMTEQGKFKLKEELHLLKTYKRSKLKERIKKAWSFCDFDQDEEYSLAVHELFATDQRIKDIETMIDHSKIIPKTIATHHIQIGSTVTFMELPNGESKTFIIVGAHESNPIKGKLSYQSSN